MRSKAGVRQAPPRVVDRRRFLKALGLGALGLGASATIRTVDAANPAPIGRVLLWLTDHGTVPENFFMNLGFSGSATQVASLTGVAASDYSPILAPLAPYAAKLNVIENIGRPAEIDYERRGGEGDRHTFGQTMVLTCVDAVTSSDIMGGAASIDQVIGNASTGAGRWAARVYGRNHFKGYSFTGSGRPTPLVSDPESAFDDIMGLYVPPAGGEPDAGPPMPTRADLVRSARASVLDFAADEFDFVAPRLGADDRRKLEEHRQLVRDLELNFQGSGTGGTGGTQPSAACDPETYTTDGADLDRFGRLASLAFSCDMTRVVLILGRLGNGDFDMPSGMNFHQDIAHEADKDATAAAVMTDFNTAYARHFASLLQHMDGISDGSGTLLDNTITTWLTELATGPHDLHNVPYVLAGSGGGHLKTGQYIKYGTPNSVEGGWDRYDIGPSNANLYVTLMQYMGMADDTFGATDIQGMSIRGPLAELLA